MNDAEVARLLELFSEAYINDIFNYVADGDIPTYFDLKGGLFTSLKCPILNINNDNREFEGVLHPTYQQSTITYECKYRDGILRDLNVDYAGGGYAHIHLKLIQIKNKYNEFSYTSSLLYVGVALAVIILITIKFKKKK